jgi:helicase required for RNAi-mediated heterochromatin assembly 1
MMGPMNLHEADAARSILQAHIKRNDKTNPYRENWRNLPELPSMEEIMPKDKIQSLEKEPTGRPLTEPKDDYQHDPIYDPNLPTNNIEGPWESKMAYVGSHYQMLREDAIASLRTAVKEVKNNPSMNDDDDTYIYTHVS